MARTITQAVYVAPQTPLYVQQFICLMADGTIWILNGSTLVWTEAPALPGGRTVTCILAPQSQLAPFVPTGYAACSDGTIWAAPLATGVWAQVATTP